MIEFSYFNTSYEVKTVETGFHEFGHTLGLGHAGMNSASDPMSYTGNGANFLIGQMEIIYYQ